MPTYYMRVFYKTVQENDYEIVKIILLHVWTYHLWSYEQG